MFNFLQNRENLLKNMVFHVIVKQASVYYLIKIMGEIMKSSTLRRSNLTREKIAMLSALSEYNASKGRSNSNLTDKQAELDMLWQNFKVAATTDRSPRTYFVMGTVFGIVVTVIGLALFNLMFGSSSISDMNFGGSNRASENVKFTFVPADKQTVNDSEVVPQEKEYVVQSGDSLEDIAMRFYGSFDGEKLKAIQEKNNLQDLNSIKIGQKLIIPMPQNKQ